MNLLIKLERRNHNMKAAVRYYTKSGNTKKLADAIAKAVGVEADTVDHQLEEDIDILFLGSSVYVLSSFKYVLSINLPSVIIFPFYTLILY